ncbi:MAG TPA: SIMPL domain-containing protein [Rhizomicrobium sp.]|nr:SIMPL domain-containing protein [Rhizomicrobium sp.]
MNHPKLFVLLLCGTVAATTAALPAMAADPTRTITVNGQGEARGVPDRAELSAGVSAVGPTANAALADNARKMTAVFDALKRLGIADRAIQTSNFSVQPQYADTTRGKGAPRITGYQVSNEVDVTLDDTKKLGGALDTLVAAGANQINSVGFDISDPAALQAKARAAAMADTQNRAQTYARAGGVGLGSVVSIQETGGDAPRPNMRMMKFEGLAGAPTPTAAGEMTVTADVSVVFELK